MTHTPLISVWDGHNPRVLRDDARLIRCLRPGTIFVATLDEEIVDGFGTAKYDNGSTAHHVGIKVPIFIRPFGKFQMEQSAVLHGKYVAEKGKTSWTIWKVQSSILEHQPGNQRYEGTDGINRDLGVDWLHGGRYGGHVRSHGGRQW